MVGSELVFVPVEMVSYPDSVSFEIVVGLVGIADYLALVILPSGCV